MNPTEGAGFSKRVARADIEFSDKCYEKAKYLYLGCAEWQEFLEYCRKLEALETVYVRLEPGKITRPSFRGMEIIRVMETTYLAVGL